MAHVLSQPPQDERMSNRLGADNGARQVDYWQRTRKLVLCFDGTGNKFHGDESDSNILKIFRLLDSSASDQCECCPVMRVRSETDFCSSILPA
jgi:uncharacterized protein (DUF2235 family)